MLRVIHIGLGPLGARVIRDLWDRGDVAPCKIIAAIDTAPELAGRVLSDVVTEQVAEEPVTTGMTDQRSIIVCKSLEALDDDILTNADAAIVTTSSDLSACADTFRSLLKLGLTVVSTCEELLWPNLRHPKLAEELHILAVEHGGRLLGTGVNPGFVMDAFPVFASSIVHRVDRVICERVQDASHRRVPFQKKIGAGLTPEEFQAAINAGTLRHVGLGESLHFVAAHLGMDVVKWDETIEPVMIGDTPVHSNAFGIIGSGKACGVLQIARGWLADDSVDKPTLFFRFKAAVGEVNPGDRVLFEGHPTIELEIKNAVPGDLGTTAMVINSVATLHSTFESGLHTMASIPPVYCNQS